MLKMKIRKALYLTLLASVLALAVAVPALADDGDTTMWVQRARIAWCGRSSGGPDRVVAKIHIFDENRAMVTGAAVKAEWTLPDGSTRVETVETGFQGIAEFETWERSGDYQICVLDVEKADWDYDAMLDREECPAIHVW